MFLTNSFRILEVQKSGQDPTLWIASDYSTAGDLQCINPVTVSKAQRPVLASPSTSREAAAAQPHGRGERRQSAARPEPQAEASPARSLPGRRPPQHRGEPREETGTKPSPSPARGTYPCPQPSATDQTPRNSLPKAPPRPGAGKDGAGCQRRRCGGTGRPAQPFVVCAAADKKGEEYTPRTHTQIHTPRVPAPPAHRSVLQLGRCAQRSLGRRGPRSPGRGGGRRRMSAMGGRKGGRKRVFWGERGPERGKEDEKEASQPHGAPSASRKALAGPRWSAPAERALTAAGSRHHRPGCCCCCGCGRRPCPAPRFPPSSPLAPPDMAAPPLLPQAPARPSLPAPPRMASSLPGAGQRRAGCSEGGQRFRCIPEAASAGHAKPCCDLPRLPQVGVRGEQMPACLQCPRWHWSGFAPDWAPLLMLLLLWPTVEERSS